MAVCLVLSHKRGQARGRRRGGLIITVAIIDGCTLQELDKHDPESLQQPVHALHQGILKIGLLTKAVRIGWEPSFFCKRSHGIQDAGGLCH